MHASSPELLTLLLCMQPAIPSARSLTDALHPGGAILGPFESTSRNARAILEVLRVPLDEILKGIRRHLVALPQRQEQLVLSTAEAAKDNAERVIEGGDTSHIRVFQKNTSTHESGTGPREQHKGTQVIGRTHPRVT
mmetsp:Transcript_18670/g.47721  ORF Transcript_18670/g.47721 Transcript_18670/m.47721 type:complete len:137 (-) Transcript_18670:371-781(-)